MTKFSIYNSPQASAHKRKGADEIFLFLHRLGNHIKVSDVIFGDDPPDFVMLLDESEIAIELTRLKRADFRLGIELPQRRRGGVLKDVGDIETAQYIKWKRDQRQLREKEEARFPWSEVSLETVFAASLKHILKKANQAGSYKKHFDEKWLLLNVDRGSPFSQIVAHLDIVHGHAVFEQICARLVFEMATVCKQAAAFAYVILFYQHHFLAFASGDNKYDLPAPDPDQVELGSKVPTKLLKYKLRTSDTLERLGGQFNLTGNIEDD